MKQSKIKLLMKLFWSTFRLSSFTFGGGYVIVPLMKKQFVDKLHWIDEKEMLDFIAIAQSSPGPIAVNASVILGYHLAGIPGALVAVFGTVLPPLILLSIISVGYSAFIGNRLIQSVLRGMGAGVCAVIIDIVIDMSGKIIKRREIMPIAIVVAAFIAVTMFNVNAMFVILTCVFIGLLSATKNNASEVQDDLP
ncbi:MAG: chromate transporter [Eubacteriales bacterium]|nr:chromate transporter [Eubacteriales bacterium]HMM01139.1 chromate transporter [Bacilli bacterium]